jgi:hypothetical protein
MLAAVFSDCGHESGGPSGVAAQSYPRAATAPGDPGKIAGPARSGWDAIRSIGRTLLLTPVSAGLKQVGARADADPATLETTLARRI